MRFQFAPALAGLARLLLGAGASLGFLSQGLRQPCDLLLHLRLRLLQLLCARRDFGLLVAGTGLQLGLLLLRFRQLLLQPAQFRLQGAPALPDLRHLLLGSFASARFSGQGFGQLPVLRFHFFLRGLELPGAGFNAGMFRAGTFLLGLLLPARLVALPL